MRKKKVNYGELLYTGKDGTKLYISPSELFKSGFLVARGIDNIVTDFDALNKLINEAKKSSPVLKKRLTDLI